MLKDKKRRKEKTREKKPQRIESDTEGGEGPGQRPNSNVP